MARFEIDFNLPPIDETNKDNDDIATRRVTITSTGAITNVDDSPYDGLPRDYPVDTTTTPFTQPALTDKLRFDAGADVTVKVVDVDANRPTPNESVASETTINVNDDVSPAAPGVVTIASKRQV